MTNQISIWFLGARPKTLGAAFAPVVAGSALGFSVGSFDWFNAILAALVALSLQVGVNYANDYSDGIKGSDSNRVGPIRLVASGLATAKSVKTASFISFAVAAIAGLILSFRINLWLVPVGAICIIAAWLYTGGRSPYGYKGFGEVSVFIFFGLVATIGSFYVQTESISIASVVTGTSLGLLSMALLIVNNLRDRPGDQQVGKLTLAVKLGDKKTRLFYMVVVIGSIVIAMLLAFTAPLATLSGLLILIAMQPIRDVVAGATGKNLISTLQQTNRLLILLGLILSISFVLA